MARQEHRLPACGVSIESHQHEPCFATHWHRHPYHSLIYVAYGQGRCALPGQSHPLGANSVILLGKNRRHQLTDEPGKATAVFVVYFSDAVMRTYRELICPLLRLPGPLHLAVHQTAAIHRLLRQMLYEQQNRPPQYQSAIRQCLGTIMLHLYRQSLTREESAAAQEGNDSLGRVKRVLETISQRYYEPQSLSVAAKQANLSQRQFTNLCRKLQRCSFARYVNQVRIGQAVQLLRQTTMPVTAIAFEVGFEDLSTFYRAFKRYQKSPPLKLRNQKTSSAKS